MKDIRELFRRSQNTLETGGVEMPEAVSCPYGGKSVPEEVWMRARRVCPSCGHHDRLPVRERIGRAKTVPYDRYREEFDAIADEIKRQVDETVAGAGED